MGRELVGITDGTADGSIYKVRRFTSVIIKKLLREGGVDGVLDGASEGVYVGLVEGGVVGAAVGLLVGTVV